MTRTDFKRFLRQNNILMKEAAFDLGYDEAHFSTVMNKRGGVPTYFLTNINNYAVIKTNKLNKRDFVEDFWNEHEMEIPHHNEWEKLKQTGLYKSLMNH